MYATSPHIHNTHPLPNYNPHTQLQPHHPHIHHNILPNPHSHHSHHSAQSNPPPSHSQRPAPPPIPKDPITVVGIPSVSIQNNHLVVGTSASSSTRSYTPLRVLGDGSFGTVWLCDWHGALPPNTPLSAMQSGTGRPEWVGKRLVAVKRMKKKWEGGWDECQKLKELESLRAIPFHPNIIPLYDFFLLPSSKELYFVFEPMEGNLLHLIKSRKRKPLAGGLVSSIFRQIVSGLDHIHTAGYFHRDMKPENVLVTTTGHFDYVNVSPIAPPNAPKERDVITIIKLADFGLARETKSKPPYTEYVSTRWYRAPEVLFLSREYSNPVDMWALGTIMAELLNLRPLFPGQNQIDQLNKICEVLGDPSDEYGVDAITKSVVGGGPWPRGLKMAKAVNFQFKRTRPRDINLLFDPNIPIPLIHCIRDLLRYNPDARLTSRQCLSHPYITDIASRNHVPMPTALGVPTIITPSSQANGSHPSLPSRTHPTSQSHNPLQIPDASSSHRSGYYSNSVSSQTLSSNYHGQEDRRGQASGTWGEANGSHNNNDYPMDLNSHLYPHDGGQAAQMQGFSGSMQNTAHANSHTPNQQSTKLGVFSTLSFGKKHNKRGLGMFGGEKANQLPPLDEVVASGSTPSLKRTQSSSTDSKSLRELSPVRDAPARHDDDVKKNNKKEAERVQREAEKQRRKLAEKMHREQARAVMQKRNQMMQKTVGNDIEWLGGNEQRLEFSETLSKGKQASSGPIRQNQNAGSSVNASTTLGAAAGRFVNQPEPPSMVDYRGASTERTAKARRREFDDDHSMSSSEVHSLGRMSSISFATVDSDPGPSRIRHRPSLFSINRMTSMSSLRTSIDDFPSSARSSNSFSLEGQLAHDFRTQATVNSPHLAGSVSPPPLHMLSLSPTLSPSLSPSSPWIHVQHSDGRSAHREQSPPYISLHQHSLGQKAYSAYEFSGQTHGHPTSPYGQPPSPLGLPPSSGNDQKPPINPIFTVVSYEWDSQGGLVPDISGDSVQPPLPPPTSNHHPGSPPALPPFSQLEAIAGGESPMSFASPSEDT